MDRTPASVSLNLYFAGRNNIRGSRGVKGILDTFTDIGIGKVHDIRG
jgi:hypothetical protein